MYENLKMSELAQKLDAGSIRNLSYRLPELDFNNCLVRDVLRRVDNNTLADLYKTGLTINLAQLAVSAAEMLIQRNLDQRFTSRTPDDNDIVKDVVVEGLQQAFDDHRIVMGSNLVGNLGFALLCKCHDHDYLLAKYGHELSRGLIFMGPKDWFKETIKNSKTIPHVAYKTPWAKALLPQQQ
ncbi:hypothetical protein IKE99_02340 [Candidatus Saccharibacteria bacterium]|nr:hypothetical protein [Candidatus Saccharibacteria bacterium]